ncbi:MAG TPA: lipid II:glycine glycyltransferase FemX [Candidatus Wunengus sp. YC65]|uniref:lipid II:glycine glycyltransferase FemX n=1 Tax=Candidatus Wunengus sp. YC65 TaxID=3367701 RepID=UPI0040267358
MKIVTIKNKKEWNDLLCRCENVDILQTWEYGEAKQNVEGWIPVRNLITDGDKPIGIAQTLVRKIPLFRGIVRINRGPLILSGHCTPHYDMSLKILDFLYNYWVKQKKMILFIAPNILKDEIDNEELQELGYNTTHNDAWVSILIDLSPDEVTLRKNLHQKWRNLLNKSGKMNLQLEIDNSDDGLSFLMSKYHQIMTEKSFSGPSEKLICEINHATANKSSIQVMFAVKNGVRIGGILVLGCIDTCHYFVGWNSLEGKIFQSNYFLLWQAMLIFKKMGYHWFDLGGISKKLTSGITHFKRGLGGKEYALIGEFEAFPPGLISLLMKKIIKLGLKYNRG